MSRRIVFPEELSQLLGLGFSRQQLDAVTAPLEPGVVIAGAGSGKTTVMAARVVWLVGTGQVRPEEVLGLTFTRKAAAELSARVRSALLRAGAIDAEGIDEAGEPLIMTMSPLVLPAAFSASTRPVPCNSPTASLSNEM